MGASSVTVCVSCDDVCGCLVSYFFSFLFAIMLRRRVWAREQSMSKRVSATCLSRMTGVLIGYRVLSLLDIPLTSWEGRTLARAVAMSYAVSLRVVPA